MVVVTPQHWLINVLPEGNLEESIRIADERFVKKALADSFVSYREQSYESVEENSLILKVLETLELVILDLHSNVSSLTSKSRETLHEVCQVAFSLLRALPIPKDQVEKIKFIYKLVTYAYLGQRWQDGRRFLIENESLWNVEIEEKEWDVRVFKKTYMAFLYLVRKSNWDDLSEVTNIIISLREEQVEYEEVYLNQVDFLSKKSSALELLGLYHLSKALDLTATYMINGEVSHIRESIDMHLDKALEVSENSSNIEMNLIIRLLKNMLNQMIMNSIWMTTSGVNSKITNFVKSITQSSKPVYELLYPQRAAILEQGLLDPAHKAIVVDMPTSSGKTIIAEFRILQALNQFSDENGWVAYVVPTRALVNQITNRLVKDLSPIGVRVAKVSGSIDIDAFEENLLDHQSNEFDILVTTAEKLNLLIRGGLERSLERPLSLAVIDEAHNLEDEHRGINYEILLANLKSDCSRANFLLLTPFVPNSLDIAKWLDPDSPADISIGLSWQPNDRVIGAVYPEGTRREWKTKYETLITQRERMKIEKIMEVDSITPLNVTRSSLTKSKIAVGFAKQMSDRKGILIICQQPQYCWNVANELSDHLHVENIDPEIELVKKYVEEELGENFILSKLLEKRIGVHHAGLPDDIRLLMEALMEQGKLNILVATTTIAQGINFPISTVIMASYSYPYGQRMPVKDFWNIVGRAGRADQGSLGLVGIVLGDNESKKEEEMKELKLYLQKSTEDLVSNLTSMVEDLGALGDKESLDILVYKDARWSQFLQYLAHMYNQSSSLNDFNTNAELFLRRTFGYRSLEISSQRKLVQKVKDYAVKLNNNKTSSTLSDSTGFSPEAIQRTIGAVSGLNLKQNIWESSRLFNSGSELKHLMGVMLTIPEIKGSLNELTSPSKEPGQYLADIISEWVSGSPLSHIAERYFDSSEGDPLTKCCRAIYSKILNSASWGLSSMIKLPVSGINFESLSLKEKQDIKNLPSMIYYGVNTSEAVLMRSVNIPRSISKELGRKFVDENDLASSSAQKALNWLENLDSQVWNEISESKKLNGSEYKKIWGILSGNL